MLPKITSRFIAISSALTLTTATFAHEGHGLTGAHWHASDTWGLLVVAAAVALAVFGGRR